MGEDLSNFINFLNCNVYIVSLLEDELFEFDIGKLPVDRFEKLDTVLDNLICQLHQIVTHSQHFNPWILLGADFQHQFALLVFFIVLLPLLQIFFSHEESICFDRLHG